jgi:hypothetical protein
MNQYLFVFGFLFFYSAVTMVIGYTYELITHRLENARAYSHSWSAKPSSISRDSWYYKAIWGFSWIMTDYVPNFVKKYLWFLLQAEAGISSGIYRVLGGLISRWYLLSDVVLPVAGIALGIAKPGPDFLYWLAAAAIYVVYTYTRIYKFVITNTPGETERGICATFAGFVLAVYLSACYSVSVWLLVPMILMYLAPVAYRVVSKTKKVKVAEC